MTLIVEKKAIAVLEACRKKNFLLASVESCTGGLIIASLTNIAGSSDVVDCGFITYSNQAKTTLVSVPEVLIKKHGAVSPEVAIAMAEGGLKHSRAHIAISVTGIAGPGGGSNKKPIGLVHMAIAQLGCETYHHVENFGNLGRESIRYATVERALDLIQDKLEDKIRATAC